MYLIIHDTQVSQRVDKAVAECDTPPMPVDELSGPVGIVG